MFVKISENSQESRYSILTQSDDKLASILWNLLFRKKLWKQHYVPADGLASRNVVWYDIGVPGILIVSMDNITYLHQFWITDPIPL